MIIKHIIWLIAILLVLSIIGFYWYGLNQEDAAETVSPFVQTIDAD